MPINPVLSAFQRLGVDVPVHQQLLGLLVQVRPDIGQVLPDVAVQSQTVALNNVAIVFQYRHLPVALIDKFVQINFSGNYPNPPDDAV